MVELANLWYSVLSQWSAQIGEPLQRLLAGQSIPAVSALLLGVIGGLAPCQVTANAGAIAYVSQGQQPLWRTVREYLAGKAAVYLLLGFLAAMLGLRLPTSVMAVLRKLNGPMLILMGLYFLGALKLSGAAGERITTWVRDHAPRRGSPAFWLGAAFSLGFCPTMAVIFFGALTPLVVQAPAGVILPAFFAVGTALPVILWAAALSAGKGLAGRWIKGVRRLDTVVRVSVAGIFLLLGLNDTVLYWLT